MRQSIISTKIRFQHSVQHLRAFRVNFLHHMPQQIVSPEIGDASFDDAACWSRWRFDDASIIDAKQRPSKPALARFNVAISASISVSSHAIDIVRFCSAVACLVGPSADFYK